MKKNLKKVLCVSFLICSVFLTCSLLRINTNKQKQARIQEIIYKSSEITIEDIETNQYYYTEKNMFDIFVRDEDEIVNEPDNVLWKYHLWFKRGSNIVEVFVADKEYYKINTECFKLSSDNDMCDLVAILIPLSTKGYACSSSHWCTDLSNGSE